MTNATGNMRTRATPRSAASSSKSAPQSRLSRVENRAAKRAAIVDAAVDLFSTRPYDQVSIDDIAKRAGVAHGLIFYYFEGKRPLLAAAITHLSDGFLAFQGPRPHEVDATERIRGLLHRHFQYVRERPAHYRLLMSNSHADRALQLELDESRTTALMGALGCPSHPSPLLRASLQGWAGFLAPVTERWLNDSDLDLDEIVDLGIHMLVAAVKISEGHRFDDASLVAALEQTTQRGVAPQQVRDRVG